MDTQETRIYLAIIITGLVLGTIIVYFTISVIRQQRKNLELQKANALAEISAMEKERARIAADLHDDMAPVLSVIKFRVEHAALPGEDSKEQLKIASEQLDGLVIRMREVANNLMPSALHRKGLISAVGEFTREARDSSGIAITVTTNKELETGEEKSIHIYRMIQEVVHNCIKHAKATRLDLSFEEKNGTLRIECRDNGIGFDYALSSALQDHIGLRSIRNRTEMMGGTLQVESKPGKGTWYLFEIPIK